MQITKPIAGKVYHFVVRCQTTKYAKLVVNALSGPKHKYYTQVQVKGSKYIDVRAEN